MSANEPRPPANRRPGGGLAAYLAIGIGAGVAIGVALQNIGLGIGIGLALGIALGSAAEASNRRASEGRGLGDHGSADDRGPDDGNAGDEEPPRPPLK